VLAVYIIDIIYHRYVIKIIFLYNCVYLLWAHKTSLTPPLLTVVSVPIQKSEQYCIGLLGKGPEWLNELGSWIT
jgi:hypothetical protein